MKFDNVTKWVRAGTTQVPPDQILVSNSVAKPRAIPVKGCAEPEVTRIQASGLSHVLTPGSVESQGIEPSHEAEGWSKLVDMVVDVVIEFKLLYL